MFFDLFLLKNKKETNELSNFGKKTFFSGCFIEIINLLSYDLKVQ
jgi:hypothetical protein